MWSVRAGQARTERLSWTETGHGFVVTAGKVRDQSVILSCRDRCDLGLPDGEYTVYLSMEESGDPSLLMIAASGGQ